MCTSASLFCFLLTVYVVTTINGSDIQEYKVKRAQIFRDENLLSLGGNIILTDKEEIVNNCLMRYKFYEVDHGYSDPHNFNLSQHFFSYKNNIKYSKVYQIIKDMPKGAVLHVHDMAILGPDYLMNLTYWDQLYVCFEKENMQLKFSNDVPNTVCENRWQLMSDARNSSTDIKKFDADVRKYFTLVVDKPEELYPTIQETWKAFMKYFSTVAPLLTYRPIWEQYFYDALKSFHEENIMYLEFRSILPNLYELDGVVYDQIVTAKAYRKVINKFVQDHPDFIGAKLIFAPSRRVNKTQLEAYLEFGRDLKQQLPDIFAGFDLVGQEDLGAPLIEFVPQLLKAAKDFNYYFHAGETNWYGTFTDENLADAILLGAKRLGHAYALVKHPSLVKEVINKDIGLEVNVLSNAILSLVRDVRNHPLATFFSEGLPVVLSSDDPGAWEADMISDDFYVAFVGVANRLANLTLLKQLALNSLKYSALDDTAKLDAIRKFNLQWNKFIEKFDCTKYD